MNLYILIFFVILSLANCINQYYVQYPSQLNVTLESSPKISYDGTSNKCVPDVCGGANFNNYGLATMLNKVPISEIQRMPYWFDGQRFLNCIKDKYIVILGDSSTQEIIEEMFKALHEMAPKATQNITYDVSNQMFNNRNQTLTIP